MNTIPLPEIPPVTPAARKNASRPAGRGLLLALVVGVLSAVAAMPTAESATLQNRYSFSETSGTTAFDPIGGQDGTLLNGASFSGGEVVLANPPGLLSSDPTGQYVDLPDNLVAGLSSITMEIWFTPDLDDVSPLAEWSRVWDFGNSDGTFGVPGFMLLRVGTNTAGIRVDMTPPGNGDSVNGPPLADLTQSHVVFTLDSAAQEARLYVNGVLVGLTPAFDSTPLAMGPTLNDWLGRSQFAADPYLTASIAELRIWDGALDPVEVSASYQNGPDTLGSPPVLNGITLDVPGTLQLESSVQARVFATIAGLPDPVEITGDDALSYSSDDPDLSIDSEGRITANAIGGGTITVTYDKDGIILVDDQFVTVTHTPTTLLHRYSFNGVDGTALDSEGTAHGIIHPEATQAGGSVSMTGSPLSYVELPSDLINASTVSKDAVTFESWASFGSSPIWARLFDFGDSNGIWGGNYIFFTPWGGSGDFRLVTSRATPAAGGFTAEDIVAQSGTLNGSANLHVVCVVDFGQNRAAIYINNVLVREILTLNTELSDIVNMFSYLGKSLYPADGNLVGSIDEFRIYDGAMIPAEIAANYLNGPDAIPGCFPVEITGQPSGTEVCEGATAMFVVAASGTETITYQWRKDGVAIPGETSSTLSISPVTANDAGVYDVQVVNDCSAVLSDMAVLTVHPTGPTITQQPESQSVCPGMDAQFEVVAVGNIGGALSYQWRKDGEDIPGATESTLILVAVDEDDSGLYDCRISEVGCGTTTSLPAELAVEDAPPVITLNGDSIMTLEACVDNYVEPGASAFDSCDGALPVAIGGDVVNSDVPSTYSVSYSAVDSSGQGAIAVRLVMVRDTRPPELSVPDNLVLDCGPDNEADIAFWLAEATAADDCGEPTIESQLTWFGACGQSQAAVTWTATDPNGLTRSLSRSLTIHPDGELTDVSFEEPELNLVLESNGVFPVSVPLLNASDCPSVVSSAQVSASFSSPAISVVSTTFPFTLCPGSGQSIGLQVDTVGALDGTYSATLTIEGPDGGAVSLPIQIVVSGMLLPDLSATFTGGGVDVFPYDSPVFPVSGEGFSIRARVKNVGPTASTPFTVKFFEGNNLLGTTAVGGLGVGQIATTNLEVPDGLIDGYYLIRAEIVPPGEGELSLANNIGGAILQVGTPPITNAEVILYASVTPNCGLLTGTLSVHAEYEITSVTTIEDAEGNPQEVVSRARFPMQGARVDASILTTPFGVDGGHTNVNGNFTTTVGLPPAGTYTVEVSVTDFTVTGEREVTLVVPEEDPCFVGGTPQEPGEPDPVYPPTDNIDLYLCSEDLRFLDTGGVNPIPMPALPGVQIQVAATVRYYSSLGSALENQRVHFTARRQFEGLVEEIPIGTVLANFAGGGTTEVRAPWVVPAEGSYSVIVRLDPDVSQPGYNDVATRALVTNNPVDPDTELRVEASGGGCSRQTISGRATYASAGTRSLSVICGAVTVRAYDQSGSLIATRNGFHTDLTGNFYFGTQISLPVGQNRLEVSVTDGTLTGSDEFIIECFASPNRPAPNTPPQSHGDLYVFSEYIGFLESDCVTALRRSPLPGEEIAIVTDLQYWDNNVNQPLEDVPVRISVFIPEGGGFRQEIVDTVLQDFEFSGGSYIACVPWTPQELGPQIVQVYIDPDDTADLPFEEYRGNNAATKLIHVGEIDCLLTASPDAREVYIGQSVDYLIDGEALGERNPTLGLTILADTPNLPPGVSFSFLPSSLTLPGQTTLTLQTTLETPPGTYFFNVVGSGEGCESVARIRLDVAGDITPPELTLLGEDPLLIECGDEFSDPGVTAIDDFDGDVSGSVEVSGAVDTGSLGDYLLTYSASDAAGNGASLTRTVTVQDTTPPEIVCPDPGNVPADASCQAVVPDLAAVATVSDNCSGPGEIIVSQNPEAGSIVGLGGHDVTLTATDPSGNSSSCVATLTVVDVTPPEITCPPFTQLVAGPDCLASLPDFTALATATDCNGPVALSQDPAPGAAMPLGMHAVTLTGIDAAGNPSSCDVGVEVIDQTPPELTCPDDMELTADDACHAAVPDLVAVSSAADCNGPVVLTQIPSAGSALGLGIFTVEVTAEDAAGNTSTCTVELTVVDETPPEVTISAPESGRIAPVGAPVTFSGSFEDCGGPFTAEWSFECQGLVDTLAGSVTGNTVSDTMTFSEAGVYRIRLSVTDAAGNSGEADTILGDLPAYLVIYDPDGGFVTGGGWIWSPPGAFHPGVGELAWLEGRASFGFVSKYKKGATTPTGQTEFQFQAGDFNFHSSDYDWLVVAGARAQFKGYGAVNHEGGYGFILTAIDGTLNGGQGVDRFRIKIWDVLSDTIVFDNQAGTGDDAELDLGTELQGGNIVIHKKK